MLKKRNLICVLFSIAGIGLVFYLGINIGKEQKELNKKPTEDFSIDLRIDNNKPQFASLSEEEILEVEKTIEIFEKCKYKKDFVKAIKMLTPAENQEEKEWLDHLLGNDLVEFNNGKPSPRFTNKVNYHLLVGYEIEKIAKRGEVFYAYTKELRLLNVAEEGVDSNYKAEIQDLTFELLNNTGTYEISRYYHTNSSSIANLKYEGFTAF